MRRKKWEKGGDASLCMFCLSTDEVGAVMLWIGSQVGFQNGGDTYVLMYGVCLHTSTYSLQIQQIHNEYKTVIDKDLSDRERAKEKPRIRKVLDGLRIMALQRHVSQVPITPEDPPKTTK